MPTYTARCLTCSHEQDYYASVADCFKTPSCERCGEPMQKIISASHVIPDVEPYLDEHLTDKPVFVKSKQHRQALMRQYGVQEKFGKGWQ